MGPLFSGTSQDLLSVPAIVCFQRSLNVKNSPPPPRPISTSGFAEAGKLGVTPASLAAWPQWRPPSPFLPQCLCTGCSLCPEYAGYLLSPPHLPPVCARTPPSQRGLPPTSPSHLPSSKTACLSWHCTHPPHAGLAMWAFWILLPALRAATWACISGIAPVGETWWSR